MQNALQSASVLFNLYKTPSHITTASKTPSSKHLTFKEVSLDHPAPDSVSFTVYAIMLAIIVIVIVIILNKFY